MDLLNRPGPNTLAQASQTQDNTNEYFEPDNYNRIFNQVSSAVDKAKQEKASLENLIGSNRDISTLTPEEIEVLKGTFYHKECADKRIPTSSCIKNLLKMTSNQFLMAEAKAKQYVKDAPKRQAQREADAKKAQEERDKQEAEQNEMARQSWADMEYEQKDQAKNHEIRQKNMRTAPNNIVTPEKQDQWVKEYETTQNILNGMKEGPDERW